MSGDKPVAIVTAASKGIGRAAAVRLAKDGYRIALIARSEAIHELAGELGGLAVQGSVAEADDLRKLVDAAVSKWGRIDAAVCNTGATARGPILSIPDEEWHEGLDMALLHAVKLGRLLAPLMEKNGGGSIVNVSSFAALEPSTTFPVSSVMRAGLSAFTRLFVEEYAIKGIRMNNVLPGFVENWTQSSSVLARIPAGRQGTLEEIAATIAFLLSPAAAYVNGQNILVDGGLVRGI